MNRRGFTLVELLVAVAIILVLMTLIGSAVSAARGSQKKQATKALIAKLDAIIQQQYARYATQSVPGNATAALAAAARRQMATGDMPDTWAEVQTLKEGTTELASSADRKFPLNAAQRAYVQYFNSVAPSRTNEDAECLFMIVMMGGLADCVECNGLAGVQIGDTDKDVDGNPAPDKAFEFLDAWGNPIGFIMWPAGLEMPPGGGKFFSTTAPFASGPVAPAMGGIMRPLIYSRGPDGAATFGAPDFSSPNSQIKAGTNCGNPADAKVATFGSFVPPSTDPGDRRADNITNFDAEVGR